MTDQLRQPSSIELTDANLLAMAAAGPTFGDIRLPQRFWAKAKVSDATGCWVWTATRQANGYGQFYFNGRLTSAHRAAYTALIAALPAFKPGGPQLDHLCRLPFCATPAHLELVIGRINIARAAGVRAASVRSRLMTGKCHRGHSDWAPVRQGTGMRCVTCERDAKRSNDATLRAAAKSLGLTTRRYGALHGWSLVTAREILDGAS